MTVTETETDTEVQKCAVSILPFKTKFNGRLKEVDNTQYALEEVGKGNSVIYLRGHKLLGKSMVPNESKSSFCMVNYRTSQSLDSTGKDGDCMDLELQCLVSDTKIYEREGNTQALDDEIKKFNEFIDLTTLIHR